ncbi:MAG: aminoglycoside phosphotransferase family protein, partial [Betaproteobacteria bacterium]|nr:aminoglycoside phosphotransferase family protein [Betaproteobacteria bacterium]
MNAVAARLLRAVGWPGGGIELTRLAGGRNNRVFRLSHDGGAPLVLKLYHHDARD